MDEKKKPPTPSGLLRIKYLNFLSCVGDGYNESSSTGIFSVGSTNKNCLIQQNNVSHTERKPDIAKQFTNYGYCPKQLSNDDLTEESDDSFTHCAFDEEDTQTIVYQRKAEDEISDKLLFDNDSSENDDSLLSSSDDLIEENTQAAANQQQVEHAFKGSYCDKPHLYAVNPSSNENLKLDTTITTTKAGTTRVDSGCETDDSENYPEVCSGPPSISDRSPEESPATCHLQTPMACCECSSEELDGSVTNAIYQREEEVTSEVSMKLNFENKKAGFSLTTDEKGHRISGVKKLLFPDLDFRDGDRIIAIQSMHVGHWDHAIMREFICDMFDPSSKPFTMIVQRFHEFIEINIDIVEIDDGDNENYFTKTKCDMAFSGNELCLRNYNNSVLSKVSLRVRRSIRYKISKPFIKVKLVEYIGERLCTVSHTVSREEKLFLRINEREKLTLEHYSLEDEKSFRFRMTKYKGIQRSNMCPERVFFCQFVSCSAERCLTIKGLTKVGLTDTVSKSWELKAVTRADPRYFKCNRTAEDSTKLTIESLVHPDLYVAVSRDKNIYLCDQRIEGETVFEINYLDTL